MPRAGVSLASLECDAAVTLLGQLRPGGRLVAPVGSGDEQRLLAVTRAAGGQQQAGEKEHVVEVLDPAGSHAPAVPLLESGVVSEAGSEAEEAARGRLEAERVEVKARRARRLRSNTCTQVPTATIASSVRF